MLKKELLLEVRSSAAVHYKASWADILPIGYLWSCKKVSIYIEL